MSNLTVVENTPLTFTPDEEAEIAARLNRARIVIQEKHLGYRADCIRQVNAVNKIIRTALNRGVPVDPSQLTLIP